MHAYLVFFHHNTFAFVFLHCMVLIPTLGVLIGKFIAAGSGKHTCRFSWCESEYVYDKATGTLVGLTCTHKGCDICRAVSGGTEKPYV